jgi:hypothetical protein
MFGWFGGSSAPEWSYPELETPLKDEDFVAIANKSFEERLAWINGTEADGWTLFHEEEGVKVYELELPGSSVHVVKAVGEMDDMNIDTLWPMVFNAPLEEKKKISEDIVNNVVLKDINADLNLTLVQYSANVAGISGREFVQLRAHKQLDNGAHFVTVTSVNYEPQPFSEGYVRGVVRSGSLLTPIAGTRKVAIVNVDHVDPKGWIPTMVVNMFKKKASSRVLKLQATYRC